jgi:hypothetical protein
MPKTHSLNRENALRNIQHLCPSLSTVLINSYREDVNLFIDGETLISAEGTTQGDLLAMAMYAIGIPPLIKSLSSEGIAQTWYADDSAACGDLKHIRDWWDHLVKVGPNYGNALKTWLIVKEGKLDEAKTTFEGTGINITLEGKRYLGAALGTSSFVTSYVQDRVSEWVKEVEKLSTFAVSQPHAAHSAFTHGVTSRWTFLVRTCPDVGHLLQPLEDAIRHKFIPALTGQCAPNDTERELLALPVRLGGLGIINPAQLTSFQHRKLRPLLLPSFYNNRQHIPLTAKSYRREPNLLLTTIGDNMIRPVPMHYSTSCQNVSKEHWRHQKRRVLQVGSQLFLLQNMASPYIKGPLGMPFALGMVGNHHACHHTVFVENNLPLNMP